MYEQLKKLHTALISRPNGLYAFFATPGLLSVALGFEQSPKGLPEKKILASKSSQEPATVNSFDNDVQPYFPTFLYVCIFLFL